MVVRIGPWNLENCFKPPSKFAPKTNAEYCVSAATAERGQ